MADFSNWVWTAASAKALVLSETCQAFVTIIFLCRTAQCETPGVGTLSSQRPLCCHIVQWFHLLLLLQLIMLLSAVRQRKLSVFHSWKNDTVLKWIRDKENDFRSKTAMYEKESGIHWHSKKLINTDCLSNSNIRAKSAFHPKSNDVATEVMQNRGILHLQITCTVSKPISFCFPAHKQTITVGAPLCMCPVKNNFQVVSSCCPVYSCTLWFLYNYSINTRANFAECQFWVDVE